MSGSILVPSYLYVPGDIQTWDLSNSIFYLNLRYQCLRPLNHHSWIQLSLLSVCMSVSSANIISFCMFVCKSRKFYLFISVCLSVSLTTCLSACMFVCKSHNLFVCLYVCLLVSQLVCLFVCLSVHLFVLQRTRTHQIFVRNFK